MSNSWVKRTIISQALSGDILIYTWLSSHHCTPADCISGSSGQRRSPSLQMHGGRAAPRMQQPERARTAGCFPCWRRPRSSSTALHRPSWNRLLARRTCGACCRRGGGIGRRRSFFCVCVDERRGYGVTEIGLAGEWSG